LVMSVDTVWYTRCPVAAAFGMVTARGWLDQELADEGIVARSLAMSIDPAVRESHFEQTQSNLFRHGGNIPPIIARSRGVDVRVIGLSWTDHAELVLSMPESGVETVADLRGRRLSLPRRAHDEFDFHRATVIRAWQSTLAVAGLEPDDVEFVELVDDRAYGDDFTDSTDQRAALWDSQSMLGFQRVEALALVRGEVDAMYSSGSPGAINKAFLGAHTVLDISQLEDRALQVNNSKPLALTVTGDLLDERPDLVARVLARTLRAADWAAEHPADARRSVAAELGVVEDLLDQACSPQWVQQLGVDLDEENLAGFASQIELLGERGFLAGDVDLDGFVAHEPLIQARALLDGQETVVT
jgi:ABC-type nitrate/sulfonate/bicarbonate transport system substrate-binding protein